MRSLLAAAVLTVAAGCGGGTGGSGTDPGFVAPTYEPAKRGEPVGPKGVKRP